MEHILLGKPVAKLLDKNSQTLINAYKVNHNKQPLLTAITIGNNPASLLYVTRKEAKAKEGILNSYKNQRAYLAIPVSDIKGLMILKNVLSCFKPSYRSVQISPRFL